MEPKRTNGQRIRRMSARGRSWLVELEGGVKLAAYRDSVGIPTLGVGQTYLLTQGRRRRVEMGDRYPSKSTALEAFDKVLAEFEAAVDAATHDDITQNEFDAFCSLAYNIGVHAFARSTAVRRFNAGESSSRVADALRMWNRADGRICEGLMERRDCEADCLMFGVYRAQGETARRYA